MNSEKKFKITEVQQRFKCAVMSLLQSAINKFDSLIKSSHFAIQLFFYHNIFYTSGYRKAATRVDRLARSSSAVLRRPPLQRPR